MKYSITTKITVTFLIIFILMASLFTIFGGVQTRNSLARAEEAQINSLNYLSDLYENSALPDDINKYFGSFNSARIANKNLIQNILGSKDILFEKKTPFGSFVSVVHNNSLYLIIKRGNIVDVFESITNKNVNDPLWVGFFIACALLLYLYISIMKSFLPLKKLNKDIKNLINGNIDFISFSTKNSDEISEVAFEFEKAVSQIKDLIRSRQLFLRTIMHELKTPIGKGRIVSEMIDDELAKKRLVNVFERLEILINEFSKIEQLLSKSYALNFRDYKFTLILDQVKDILMLDNWENKVEVDIEKDPIIRADFQLFSLAIKNLLDNGLKYSTDAKVRICSHKDYIVVSNIGNPFSVSVEHYKQAFIRNKNEKVGGMGLGLYIIDTIIEMHGFKFKYKYANGRHNFYIYFEKSDVLPNKNNV